MAKNDPVELPSTAETVQQATPAPAQMGPVDRLMDPLIRKALETLAPSNYRQSLADNYARNRTKWNLGALALGGAGLTAATKAIANAFNNDDDEEEEDHVPRRRRRSGSSNIVGNTMSWLAPMALLAGGGYLWNKYGDQVTGKVNEGLTNLKAAVAADKKWETRYKNLLQGVRKIPLIGNWAANKIHGSLNK